MTKTKRKAKNYSLSPAAFYTALCGLNLLALAMCDTALRVESAIAQNPNLIGSAYIPAMETVFGSLVLLCGGVLLIDYQVRH